MADHTELLRSMLQDIINDKQENASVTMHDYFVSKTREVSGLAQEPEPVAYHDDNNDDFNDDDEDNQNDDE